MHITPDAPIPAWSSLEEAFEYDANAIAAFYDRDTGEVVGFMADPGMRCEGDQAMMDRIDSAPGRYLRIDPVDAREKFGWMEAFVETVGDPRLAGRLEGALGGPRPFRRFKDERYGEERERWFAFSRERVRRHVVEWVEAHELPVGAAPPWPAPAEEPELDDDELRRVAHACIDRVPSSELPRAAALLQSLVASPR